MMEPHPHLRPSPSEVLLDPLVRDDVEWKLHLQIQENQKLAQRIEQLEQELNRQKITFRAPLKKSRKLEYPPQPSPLSTPPPSTSASHFRESSLQYPSTAVTNSPAAFSMSMPPHEVEDTDMEGNTQFVV